MKKTLLATLFGTLAAYSQGALALHIRGPLELAFGQGLRAPGFLTRMAQNSGQAGQWCGRTALASGTAFATLSTAIINSDSIVHHGFAVSTTAGSGTNFAIGISSIVSGVSFALGYVDGQGRAPGGTLMWEIRRTS